MADLETFLQERFSFDSFHKGQKETIEALLAQKNVLTILPTGAGKSLCYQFPSYYKNDGHTVIISPLISLMEDQVSLLRKNGEKSVVAINSLLSGRSKKYLLKNLQKFRFIFISPESLSQEETLKYFKDLKISLLVVDEAHCISHWGHDFRPNYLELKHIRQQLGRPLTLALTATATDEVKQDIISELFDGESFEEISESVNRSNIFFEVIKVEDKLTYLLTFLEDKHVPGIIYFSSKNEADKVAEELNQHLPYAVQSYHGDMSSDDRIRIQEQFIRDDIRVLCATSAFGMGINKSNIRFVIHYHMPDSLENYVQESGRAGRDGLQSLSIILYKKGDEQIHFFLQDQTFEEKKALLFLENKTEKEIELLKNSMTDIQKKWYEHIKKNNVGWQNYKLTSEKKKRLNQLKIYDMIQLCESQECRREMIQKYFNEDNMLNQSDCCDNCGHNEPDISMIGKVEKSELNDLNPQKKLEKMFFS